jgi:hypothetical protein
MHETLLFGRAISFDSVFFADNKNFQMIQGEEGRRNGQKV